MSAALEENTKALNRLNNTLLSIFKMAGAVAVVAEPVASAHGNAAAKAIKETTAKTEAKKQEAGATPVTPAANPAPAATAPTPTETTKATDKPTVDYKTLAAAVTAHVVSKGKDSALALLAPFEITLLQNAKPEQFDAIYKAFTE